MVYVSEENWGLDGKPQRGSPRHSNHQHPEMLLEKVFESVSSLYLLLPKTGSDNNKKNKIQESPLPRNAARESLSTFFISSNNWVFFKKKQIPRYFAGISSTTNKPHTASRCC